MNSIMNILKTYSFEIREDNTMWWGIGSLVSGHIADVKYLGQDLYRVAYRRWMYDSYGDLVVDKDEYVVLHGALMLQYLFERLPFNMMIRFTR